MAGLLKIFKPLQTENSTQWEIPKELRDLASIEELKFIYMRAEKALSDTKKSDEFVTSRTVTVISFLVTILVALIGFMYNQLSTKINNNYHSVVLIGIAIIYVYILIFLLYKNLKSQLTYYEGTHPKMLFTKDFLGDATSEKRLLFFYEAELQNIQRAIDSNIIKNNAKWNRYDYTLKAFISLPIILVLISALF